MTYYSAPRSRLSPRTTVLAAIVACHVVMAYLFATGLVRTIVPAMEPAIDARLLPQPAPPPAVLPPRVPLALSHVPLADPLPPPPGPADESVPQPPPEEVPREGTVGPIEDRPELPPLRMLGRNVLPDAEDYYPARQRREAVQGATLLKVCVDERGQRLGEPQLEGSSGDGGLDQAALSVARHGRYARAVRGSEPVPNCYHFRIVFRMR